MALYFLPYSIPSHFAFAIHRLPDAPNPAHNIVIWHEAPETGIDGAYGIVTCHEVIVVGKGICVNDLIP